jgi:hypothetical protein
LIALFLQLNNSPGGENMDLPQIRMESDFGKIGLTTQNGYQTIEQPKAEISIRQSKAELNIETTDGKLTINQTKAWEDMDLKHIFRRIEEYAQNGYQDWLSGLARMSQEGDDLMKIESGGNPIAEHAKINSESPMYDFNIAFIPEHFSVKTNYQPGNLKIDWRTNSPEIEVKVNKPHIEYIPGKVNGEMKQWPSLYIDFIGLEVDEKK